MPELRLKEVRLPELHLPEMSRDDIARAIGEKRRDVDLTKVDLTRLDPRRMDLPDVNLTKIDVSKIDVPKALTGAAQAVGLVRRPRPRWPFILGGMVALFMVGMAVLNTPAVKQRLAEMAQRARERMDERRAQAASEMNAPRAFDAAVAVPIEPSAYADDTAPAGSPFDGPSPLPEGFGADVADESPTAGEESTRA